jgi:phosphopentomutase
MRAIVLVIDSFGIGELPDASDFGDEGSNTAAHICAAVPDISWPNLQAFGLGNASEILGNVLRGCEAVDLPKASFGVMAERSIGKDTTTGHWELMGVILDEPFRTFPNGPPSFPDTLVDAFETQIHRSILGNCAASGTQIIQELGNEHLRTGKPIVYTSGDSVFQIAVHEQVIPLDELYRMCGIARTLCDSYRVARIIARPFVGVSGDYSRTEGRRDFSMLPTSETLLERLEAHGVETIGIGKIGDIFSERGIVTSYHDKGNEACLERTVSVLEERSQNDRLIFVNLVDTDMIYGHRRDAAGYASAVARIDVKLPEIAAKLAPGDALIITADHGCDPTYRGTDHTREYVPLMWYEPDRVPVSLGVKASFSDLSQSLAHRFGADAMTHGVEVFE